MRGARAKHAARLPRHDVAIGVVQTARGPVLTEVRNVVSRHALRQPFTSTEIVLCPIARNPVSLGAATFALEGFLSTIRQPTVRAATSDHGHARAAARWRLDGQ